MLAFLKLAWAYRSLIGILALCAFVGGLWLRNDYLAHNLDIAKRTNAIYAKQMPVLRQERDRLLWRTQKVEQIRGEIAHAEDGPVAPALRIAVERLRELDTPARSR